jgi:hypothetical protein
MIRGDFRGPAFPGTKRGEPLIRLAYELPRGYSLFGGEVSQLADPSVVRRIRQRLEPRLR